MDKKKNKELEKKLERDLRKKFKYKLKKQMEKEINEYPDNSVVALGKKNDADNPEKGRAANEKSKAIVVPICNKAKEKINHLVKKTATIPPALTRSAKTRSNLKKSTTKLGYAPMPLKTTAKNSGARKPDRFW
ncbi:hypothetical protein [Fictibacillus barbaricus]|uniref:Uncharacterized protein n=1 Tax=Fictibacillus barbaricus TaxID=182136 RepID=A0ABS2ZD68_9BACL|nr:hypothetical protein [Fictibacillus barbaricus]MBN3546134.1 hypothetical protein [Fictibacillus barbaricus]GGB58949.1 hypothetical protein GCM10007199_26000 [Fictibacillus barbaricus]